MSESLLSETIVARAAAGPRCLVSKIAQNELTAAMRRASVVLHGVQLLDIARHSALQRLPIDGEGIQRRVWPRQQQICRVKHEVDELALSQALEQMDTRSPCAGRSNAGQVDVGSLLESTS